MSNYLIKKKANKYKQAEKEYLKRTKGYLWEQYKPFTPPGHLYNDDSFHLIDDFCKVLSVLEADKECIILDAGAGGCWVSEWLQRLQFKTVSLDLSIDMLRVGAERLQNKRSVVGDMERIPLINNSVDRIICMHSLHHVPDMELVIKEFYRILSKNGRVVFCEPGVGHSNSPASLLARDDFGLLEQDIMIEELYKWCQEAGFKSMVIKPIMNIDPQYNMKVEEWRVLKENSHYISKIYKKWGGESWFYKFKDILHIIIRLLFIIIKSIKILIIKIIEVLEIYMLNIERNILFVAYKSTVTEDKKEEISIKASIHPDTNSIDCYPAEELALHVKVTNLSSFEWLSSGEIIGDYRLGIKLKDDTGKILDNGFARIGLPMSIKPKEQVNIICRFNAPKNEGSYILTFDIVKEGKFWFSQYGSDRALVNLKVKTGNKNAL